MKAQALELLGRDAEAVEEQRIAFELDYKVSLYHDFYLAVASPFPFPLTQGDRWRTRLTHFTPTPPHTVDLDPLPRRLSVRSASPARRHGTLTHGMVHARMREASGRCASHVSLPTTLHSLGNMMSPQV